MHQKCLKSPAVLVVAFAIAFVLLCLLIWNQKPMMENAGTDGQVILPITIASGDASWETCVREVAAMYMEEHPQVDVRVHATVSKENTDYAKSLLIQEALGNFHGIAEMKSTQLYAEAGKLAELPDWLTDQMRSVSRLDGSVYAVPRYYTSRGVIYNKALFQELGLSIPKTWQEFLRLCQTLKEHGVIPITMGLQDLWHLNHWSNGLFINDVQQEVPNWLEKCRKGKVHWTDEKPKKMLSDFKELFEKVYVEAHFAEISDAETIERLTEGRAAMLYSVTALFSQILKVDPEFEMGWFFLPNDSSLPVAGLDGSWQWTIAASSREEGIYDAALDFLKFYYREDVYRTVLQRMNGISSLKQEVVYESIDIQKQLLEMTSGEVKLQEDFWSQPEVPEGFGNSLYQNMLWLAEGRQSVEETAEILEQEWREGCGEMQ